jgi:hypothetical protein
VELAWKAGQFCCILTLGIEARNVADARIANNLDTFLFIPAYAGFLISLGADSGAAGAQTGRHVAGDSFNPLLTPVGEAGLLLAGIKGVRAMRTAAIGPAGRETMITRTLAGCVQRALSPISMRPLANSIP